jgi:hypothetical protein
MNDPLGPPRWFFRDRSVKDHLQHHAVQARGQVQSVRRPRSVFRPDGTFHVETGSVTIRFWDGTQARKVTSAMPSLYEHHIKPGQSIPVAYCPYYPTKIYRIIWPNLWRRS